jgi:hypothetical protein
LTVQYKPPTGPISWVACLTTIVDLELFPQIHKGEALLNEKEREREVGLRVPP